MMPLRRGNNEEARGAEGAEGAEGALDSFWGLMIRMIFSQAQVWGPSLFVSTIKEALIQHD